MTGHPITCLPMTCHPMTCHAINCPFGATACHGCSCRGCFVMPSHDLPCNHLPCHSLPKLAMKCYVCSAIACPVFPCCGMPGCLTMACHACLLRDVFIVMPCKGQPCLHCLFITYHDFPSIARLWLAMHACLAMFTLPCLANLPVRLQQQHHLARVPVLLFKAWNWKYRTTMTCFYQPFDQKFCCSFCDIMVPVKDIFSCSE